MVNYICTIHGCCGLVHLKSTRIKDVVLHKGFFFHGKQLPLSNNSWRRLDLRSIVTLPDVVYFWLVIAFSKPNVNISANLTRLKGQAAELSCNVTGNPSPEISWFRNGEKIETENTIGHVKDCQRRKSGFYKIKDEEVEKYGVLESRLVVCSAAHLNHTGSYTCEASNSIGNDTATAYVNILGTYHWMLREAICNDNF